MKNKYLLIGTHGEFGKELVKSAEMIMGKTENVHVFSLLPNMDPMDYVQSIRDTLSQLDGEFLCLVDLYGGTPSNMFAMLSREYQISVISGLNLGMFLEVYSNFEMKTIPELKEVALSSLNQSGRDVLKTIFQK